MQLELQANVKRPISFEGLTSEQASKYINKLNRQIKEYQNG